MKRIMMGLIFLVGFCSFLVTPIVVFADELDEIYRLTDEKKFDTATSRLDAYLRKNPKDPQALFLRGLILTEQKKRDEAIAVFKDLGREYPELPEPFNNLAVLYAEQGQYESAREALQQAIKTHPSYVTAHENLGDIYAKLASLSYARALQLNKNNAQTQEKLVLVNKLFVLHPGSEETSAPKSSKKEVVQPSVSDLPPPPMKEGETVVPSRQELQYQARAEPSVPASSTGGDASSSTMTDVRQTLEDWAKAWSDQNVDKYLSFYGDGFHVPPGYPNRSTWEQKRRAVIQKAKLVHVELSDLQVQMVNNNQANIRFQQHYSAHNYRDQSEKNVVLEKQNGRWKIMDESSK
ncbi:MAG: tetratricopeptide repeat protein [Magnetococcus sp. DMHC-6]